jgi:hypothetical protein
MVAAHFETSADLSLSSNFVDFHLFTGCDTRVGGIATPGDGNGLGAPPAVCTERRRACLTFREEELRCKRQLFRTIVDRAKRKTGRHIIRIDPMEFRRARSNGFRLTNNLHMEGL